MPEYVKLKKLTRAPGGREEEKKSDDEGKFLTVQRGHDGLPQRQHQPQRRAEQEEVGHLEVELSQGAPLQHGAVAGAPGAGLPVEHAGVKAERRGKIGAKKERQQEPIKFQLWKFGGEK